MLESAVLGDSGFMIFGVDDDDIIEMKYKSPSFQKKFN